MESPSISPSAPLSWRKSSYCAAGECAEISNESTGTIVMRNSTKPGDVIRLSRQEWQALARGIKAGEFDDLG